MRSNQHKKLTLKVKVKPRSRQPGIEPADSGEMIIRVKAAPVRGQANEEACRLLAAHFGLPRSAVKIVAGGSSTWKLVEIFGLDSEVKLPDGGKG